MLTLVLHHACSAVRVRNDRLKHQKIFNCKESSLLLAGARLGRSDIALQQRLAIIVHCDCYGKQVQAIRAVWKNAARN